MFVKTLKILLLLLIVIPLSGWAGPKIEQWRLPQGAKVYYVHNPQLPLVDIRVLFAAGSAWDGEKYGLATLTSALLDTGAGEWNADEIALRLESVGAQLGTGVSRDSAWLSLRSLTESDKLQTALETAAEILKSPRFAHLDFQREKKRLLLGLKQREESPGELAGMMFFEAIYRNYPYAHPSDGTIETVQAIQRQDLREFHQRYYVASNAVVVIVGAVDKSEAKKIAKALVGGLPEGEPAPAIPEVPVPEKADIQRKVFPSAQTHIYTGMPVLKRKDLDYFPLYVGNYALGGGGFVSRIVKEVREKRGFAYSAYSYFAPMKEKGPYLAGLQTRNDQAYPALEVLRKTIAEFQAKGPTIEELKAAKKNITGGFVLRYDSNSKLAEYVAMIGFYDLPLDYLDTFTEKVEKVTISEIADAFRRRIDLNRFQTVLVGGGAVRQSKSGDEK